MKNLLRFTLVVGDSNSSTFYSNLLKLIKMELSEAGPKGISLTELSNLLIENFDLEFTNEELLKAIEKDKDNTIIKLSLDGNKKYTTYTLIPKECEKYNKKKNNALHKIVDKFINENNKYNDEQKDQIVNLITQFIYNAFNEDKKTFLSYMNYTEKKENLNGNHKFNDDEIQIINDFLLWDNKEKDNYIYHSVSSCYEYCLLTLKKDNNFFEQVFNQKVFYLDSNILFKYILFENHEQHRMVKRFIEKCKSAGITLKYTNFTRQEIMTTISNHVNFLKGVLQGHAPISHTAIKAISPSFKNYDFYESYYLWQVDNPQKSFAEFKEYLEKRVTTQLNQFKYESHESFDSKATKKEFETLTSDLNEYKKEYGKITSEEPIKHDVNSYMFMRKKNADQEKNSFMNVKYYFITFDKVLVNWTSEKNMGDIPTFVLPSVWYSTLLKYKNRTENDYEAFCKFLSITTGVDEIKNTQEETRNEILSKIIKLDESSDYKEELIYRIDKKLREENLLVENVDDFVLQEQKSLTDEKIDFATKEVKEEKQVEIDNLIIESKKQQTLSYIHGQEQARNEIVNKQTQKTIKRNKIIRVILKIFLILGISIAAILLLFTIIDKDWNSKFQTFNDNALAIDGIISCITIILNACVKNNKLLSIDEKTVKEKVARKLGC